MKFHHLARHNQFVATAAAVAAAAAAQNNPLANQRVLSPSKIMQHHLNQHHQQATSIFGSESSSNNNNNNNATSSSNNNNNTSLTDDEDEDDFSEAQSNYFDAIRSAAAAAGGLQSSLAPSHHNNLDHNNQNQEANFLMDKNKKLFPQKLWELIHNPSIQHCLRWSQDGQRVYLNRNEFEAYYLKTPNNQFHTQKAISFVRQMNMYGFRKVDDCYYENDNFRRDRQHLLRNMIRRHPNKGLFVGLDHHQLAAAAAAQQALQVNQQLQHLENQHKHRQEQALRLNSYLNSHHQYHQLSHHQHPHSSPFEHMSSQLVAQVAAANQQLSQQQQLQQPLPGQPSGQLGNGGAPANMEALHLATSGAQAKKCRLLSNFYASAGAAPNNNQAGQATLNKTLPKEALHSQDSMQSSTGGSSSSSSSVCLDLENAGSANGALQSQQLAQQHQQGQSAIRAAVLAAAAAAQQQQVAEPEGAGQLTATDLSQAAGSQAELASRQAALHQSLVRSLLQLKQQPAISQQDLLSSALQQHRNHSRSLLESLASFSSAGSGSIVDPTSDSPTERTVTPPSIPSSPAPVYQKENNNNNMALDLAKSSQQPAKERKLSLKKRFDELYNSFEQPDQLRASSLAEEDTELEDADDASPLEGERKVRRFLDKQMQVLARLKREPAEDLVGQSPERKRRRTSRQASNEGRQLEEEDDNLSISSISKSLILEFCDKRGDRLEISALNEAARYTECFLDVLLENASSIARSNFSSSASTASSADSSISSNESTDGKESANSDKEIVVGSSSSDSGDKSCSEEETGPGSKCKPGLVDTCSLSLALKLIPSKLIAAIEQQQQVLRVGASVN